MSTSIEQHPIIHIWSKTPEQFLAEKQNIRVPIKTKRWGFRHAIYAALISIAAQLIITIGYMSVKTSEYVLTGLTPADAEAAVLEQITKPSLILLIIQLSMYASWLGTMFYVTYKKGLHSFAKDFWLKFKWKIDIPLGLGIALGLRIIELSITNLLKWLGVDMTGASNTEIFLGNDIWAYVFVILIASLLGPIVEEFFFRGLMMQGLIKTFRYNNTVPKTRFGQLVHKHLPTFYKAYVSFKKTAYKHKYLLAAIISSVLFGFMHFQGVETFGQWWVIIVTGSIGFILALIVLKTRRLGLAITTHVAFNSYAMILLTVTQ